MNMTGVEEPLADQLLAKNIRSVTDMAYAKMEDLTILRAIDDAFAVSLIEEARKTLGEDYKPVVMTAEASVETVTEATVESAGEVPVETVAEATAESAGEVAVETVSEDDQEKQVDAGDDHLGATEDNGTDGEEG